MNKDLLHIDISESYLESKDDLIDIEFANGYRIQVKFSKLVDQSKYIRDEYKYSEAVNFFQNEIDKLENNLKINEESIKLFIELIQQEKVNIPIKHYRDFYTLSEYFRIPRFTHALDNIRQQKLFNDLDFTIQLLFDSELAENEIETKLTSKIESFLSCSVNKCIEIQKFRELPATKIYRIIDKCDKEKVNMDLLLDFILESIGNRFILLKFAKLHKLKEVKVKKIFNFIEEHEEKSREMYLEYMPFDMLFIKQTEEKYNNLFIKNHQT